MSDYPKKKGPPPILLSHSSRMSHRCSSWKGLSLAIPPCCISTITFTTASLEAEAKREAVSLASPSFSTVFSQASPPSSLSPMSRSIVWFERQALTSFFLFAA